MTEDIREHKAGDGSVDPADFNALVDAVKALQESAGGLPPGGNTGQVLTKESPADGDADWEDSGGGSQTVKTVDLGVLDVAAILAGGPQLLYTMQAGEYLANIRWTDTDYVDLDSLPVPFGVGTVKSFGWWSFATIQPFGGSVLNMSWGSGSVAKFWDTPSLAFYALNYDPRSATLGTTAPTNAAMILSAAAAGNIYAAGFVSVVGGSIGGGPGDGSSVRLAAIAAWQSNHGYDTAVDSSVATPGAVKHAAITANGTVWVNNGDPGTSGGSAPDFAGNAGGTVADGPDIVWADTAAALTTTGTARAIAEIWTPA